MITVKSETSWATLEDQIRHVALLQPRDGELIYPYIEAEISLTEIKYADVRPTSLYVLNHNLDVQRRLTKELLPKYDPLQLHCGLTLVNEHDKEIGLIPPIVEETTSEGKYLLDGMHRAYVGRAAGRTTFMAIHIVDFREDCPAAAWPSSWDEVTAYDKVPSDPSLKRRYRNNPHSLRRNFSPLNGSKPRT